jgi:hypothetical protein
MNLSQLTGRSVAGFGHDRRRIGALPDRRIAGLRPAIKATGWILAGAGVGSLAVVALLWALTTFTSLQDISHTWTVVKTDQYPLAR